MKPQPYQFYRQHPGFFYTQYDDYLIFGKEEFDLAMDEWELKQEDKKCLE